MAGRKVISITAAASAAPAGGGWRALSTLSEPRLSEMAENYRALGYEVQVRDVQTTAQTGGCTTCLDAGAAAGNTYGTLYVRRKPGPPPSDEPFE